MDLEIIYMVAWVFMVFLCIDSHKNRLGIVYNLIGVLGLGYVGFWLYVTYGAPFDNIVFAMSTLLFSLYGLVKMFEHW